RIDGFELSKLGGEELVRTVAEAIDTADAPNIYCSGLDGMISRMLQSVIDSSIDRYVTEDESTEERNFGPLGAWADGLGLRISKDQWAALTREELPVLFGSQVLELPEDEALEFARRCIRSSVTQFLASEAFAEDQSYEHLAAWSRGRFSFAASPVKLQSAVSKKVDAARARAKQQLTESLVKEIEAEGLEPPEIIDRLVAAALSAYFTTTVGTEEIALEPLARWVNSTLHVSAPAAEMHEMMDIDERTLTNLICERAQKSLARKKPPRIAADVITASVDCFLPPETLPDTWYAEAFEDWLKQCGLDGYLDVYELLEDVSTAVLDVFVEAATAGYKERSPRAVAVDAARHAVDIFLDSDLSDEGRNLAGLADKMNRKFDLGLDPFELSKLAPSAIRDLIEDRAFAALDERTAKMGRRQLHWVARVLILQAIDSRWKDHLELMDHLKSGIGMRGYAAVDPKIAYKKEGYEAFDVMVASIHEEVSDMLLKVEIELGTEVEEEEEEVSLVHHAVSAYEQAAAEQQAAGAPSKSDPVRRPVRATKEPGRNDPCPCGSGKKYKNCCMRKG
ncbi:MAG: SEC-C metal-binding domain-containing protein, partial [Planctomycetota bacterium]